MIIGVELKIKGISVGSLSYMTDKPATLTIDIPDHILDPNFDTVFVELEGGQLLNIKLPEAKTVKT
jgi:hypothetical protein